MRGLWAALYARGPEDSGCSERVTQDARHANRMTSARLLRGDLQDRRPAGLGGLTPIESAVSVENL